MTSGGAAALATMLEAVEFRTSPHGDSPQGCGGGSGNNVSLNPPHHHHSPFPSSPSSSRVVDEAARAILEHCLSAAEQCGGSLDTLAGLSASLMALLLPSSPCPGFR